MHYDQKIRYARNISLPEIGEKGQQKLLDSKVLVIGAGGLGSPLLFYLTAAGVGTVGIIDDDKVALSNLQRQIIHETQDTGRSKSSSAADSLSFLNPEIKIKTYNERLDSSNAGKIISQYDLVADGCDNFETRLLVNEICYKHKKPLISGAAIGFKGHISTFKPFLGGKHPCYQCIVPELPPADATPKCSESGILGAVTGIIGSWQAQEVIKEITGAGESLSGYMITYDGLTLDVKKIRVKPDPKCKCCGS